MLLSWLLTILSANIAHFQLIIATFAAKCVSDKLVIDELVHDITHEYNMTTLINTHDMNSVMGIGEKIIYIYDGYKEWEGSKDDIFTSSNKKLNDFIFASDLFRKVKELEVQNIEG